MDSMEGREGSSAVAERGLATPEARMAQGDIMAYQYDGEVTTKRNVMNVDGTKKLDKAGKEVFERVIQAVYRFEGPEKAADFDAAPPTGSFMVTAFLLEPPVVVGPDGSAKTVIPEAAKKPMTPYPVEHFKAWKYGAGLLAGAPARQAAEAGTVTDHKINFQGKVTDLDTLSGETLVIAVNKLAGLGTISIDIGVGNVAKLNHKIEEMVKAGLATKDQNGNLVAKKNGAAKK